MTNEKENTVKLGTWRYDGTISCEVRIVKPDTATHWDYEDGTSETDLKIECYYVLWESSAEKGKLGSQVGQFLKISDAVAYVERSVSEVRWQS